MAKMVNATFAYQKTGGVNILVNDLHLPCLPHVYSSVFIYLRKYFCKEQICANPFFWPVFHPGVIDEIILHVYWLTKLPLFISVFSFPDQLTLIV